LELKRKKKLIGGSVSAKARRLIKGGECLQVAPGLEKMKRRRMEGPTNKEEKMLESWPVRVRLVVGLYACIKDQAIHGCRRS